MQNTVIYIVINIGKYSEIKKEKKHNEANSLEAQNYTVVHSYNCLQSINSSLILLFYKRSSQVKKGVRLKTPVPEPLEIYFAN